MEHNEIKNGLFQLGFENGWVLIGEEIVIWENAETRPSGAEIKAAAAIYQQTIQRVAAEKALEKAALLERLGITAEEAELLLS